MSDRIPVQAQDPAGGAPGQVPTINAAGTAVEYADPPTGGGGSGVVVETIVAGTGITVDATDPANPVVSATGGGAVTALTVRNRTVESSGGIPTAAGVSVPGLQITGITGGRTVLVTAGVAHDAHPNRFGIGVDGVLVTPMMGMTSDDSARYTWTVGAIPVTLTSGTHTISVLWNAQGTTAAVTFADRWLTVM